MREAATYAELGGLPPLPPLPDDRALRHGVARPTRVALRGALVWAAVTGSRSRPPPPCELLTGCRGDVREVTA